ncbi:uncharacterized protein LOC113336957 [Papaver somniferum]|uniref:uncharacterized protein LOC113336957 n=1 Tax=Papaver somniferum TaxID=3469 RepID=UPI000E70277B|nr:uncharacterized protein LOC113336957 [Papaver somniferum]
MKHPYSRPPVVPAGNPNVAAVIVDVQDVVKALKSFPKGTSCGRDGFRSQHLLDATNGAASVADELLSYITGVANLWIDGQCPLALGEYISSAPLTPLLKPGGGIHQIAVGTIWRRLYSKLAASAVLKYMTSYLGKHQFGVGTPCRGEGILHSVNRLLELKDDGTLVGETTEVAKSLQIIREEGPARGLQLNIQKTEIFWPHPDPRCNDVFPSAIGMPETSVSLIGGPVSLNDEFCSNIIQYHVDKTLHLMDCVKKLRDPQVELLLLRYCAKVSKLYF